MNTDETAVRRALQALRSAADRAEEEHPGIEVLEAYVEGRLSAHERAEVERLAAQSSVVAEDLADLQAIDRELAARPAASRNIRWGRVAGAAAVAATLVAGVWLAMRPVSVERAAPPEARTALTGEEQDLVRRAIQEGRITVPPMVASLMQSGGTLLGAAPSPTVFSPLTPIGTAVRSPRPVFSWSDAGADAYTVAIFDENFAEVARSPRVNGTTWTPPVDLPRGVRLAWQVTAHRASADVTAPQPPQPEARFMVIDPATAARVTAFEARAGADDLSLGVLLADAGLLAEARGHLERAAKTSPQAERLLASLTR